MRYALRRWESHHASSSSSSSSGRQQRSRRWRKGARVSGAWELSGIANDVYEYNGEHRPTEGNISRVTVREVDAHAAQLWMMSPPCQPYTRVGLRRDAADPRARSLLDLLALLPHLSHPPSYLLLENVLGFEARLRIIVFLSCRHNKPTTSVGECGQGDGGAVFAQTVLVSPNDIEGGEPYSRPRCYVLAKRSPLKFALPHLDGKIIVGMPGRYPHSGEDSGDSQAKAGRRNRHLRIRPVREFLEADVDIGEYGVTEHILSRLSHIAAAASRKAIRSMPKAPARYLQQRHRKPNIVKHVDTLERTSDQHVLLNQVKELGDGWEPITDATLAERGLGLHDLGLRYFTPREIANLHGFPQDFAFPESTTLRQRYALLGNSLSVTVVALLLDYLLTDDVEQVVDNMKREAPPAT
eukprot:jgi/Chlat1/4594/Chrsp290S08883